MSTLAGAVIVTLGMAAQFALGVAVGRFIHAGSGPTPPPMPQCTRAIPRGWRCTRQPDHDGPCALIPEY